MNDRRDDQGGSESQAGGDAREPYEAPRLTTVGNARDLLAGASGPVPDADPCAGPGQETQPG
jgi:hypothetical protein